MTTPDGVLDLVQRWAAAEQRNDATALDGLLDRDFAGVGPLGFVLTREQWLARFASGLENRAFTVEDPQVRRFGDVAVVIGVLTQETSWQGNDDSGRFRITLVAVRPAGTWLLAHVHIGMLQGGPAVTEAFLPKVVAPGEGKTVMLFGVRFGYKVVSEDSAARLAVLEVEIPARTLVKPRGVPHAMWNAAGAPAKVAEILCPAGLEGYVEALAPILAEHRPAAEYYRLAEDYGITIEDDWIEELERTYGVKL